MERILVVGAGTMGAGIAFVAARAGFAVDLVDPDKTVRERASTPAFAAAAVKFHDAIPTASEAVLAIEAVPERLELKREVFRALESAVGPQTPIATNTSALSVDSIASALQRPERAVGMHFFNPPAAMRLVEIVRGEQTADETVDRALEFARRFEKDAVVTADSPGFIVNRVARPFYLQSLRALAAGAAPIEDLDRLARGIGFRMGPFELMDLIGLDINLATSESIYARTDAQRLEPSPLQREMVEAGTLGRKSGRGFYAYPHERGPARTDDAAVDDTDLNEDERVVVLGFGSLGLEFSELLGQHFAHVETIENDEFVGEIGMDVTIAIDTGDGVSDRADVIRELDTLLPPETVIFVDAYATDMHALCKRLAHPERVVGYGILGTLAGQRVVEIVDSESTGDDALELAQEVFAALGKGVALVEESPALYVGRTVGSIVNEAMYAVQEGVANADDIDTAMRLGTNYPIGPIAWGREVGGRRISRILQRLADAEGAAFAPHRALWVLDAVEEAPEAEPVADA